ncbi:integrator complex subunit 13-like isoform X2 [Gordionus sp. m RMFG-2023]|uniref:integrator complex subunit 13-like isoform X2 n=1 Tax=Gordionus sp. m RMFG-2023 TaxID=3053472 RepID=UPI0031FCB508
MWKVSCFLAFFDEDIGNFSNINEIASYKSGSSSDILKNFAKINIKLIQKTFNDNCDNRNFKNLINHSFNQFAMPKIESYDNNKIIYFSHFILEEKLNQIKEIITEAFYIKLKNLPIKIEVILINISSFSSHTQLKRINCALKQNLNLTIYDVPYGKHLAHLILYLVQKHYNLCSTTITGIPMKEEQNFSGTSCNYDVEILHSSRAYMASNCVSYRDKSRLQTAGILNFQPDSLKTRPSVSMTVADANILMNNDSNSNEKKGYYEEIGYRTVLLQWCTPPKNSINNNTDYYQQNSHGAYKISPVDPHSRPSSCLTNFVLSNRIVLLEQHQNLKLISSILSNVTDNNTAKLDVANGYEKILSHMLSQVNGAIYIMCLGGSCKAKNEYKKMYFEDLHSITEGPGGKVTDYRIPDFSKLIKISRLTRRENVKYSTQKGLKDQNNLICSLPEIHLSRLTKYWPLVYSDCVLLNIPLLIPLIENISVGFKLKEQKEREKLKLECVQILNSFKDSERQNLNLSLPPALMTSIYSSLSSNTSSSASSSTPTISSKHQNKKEIYKYVWNEIATLINTFCHTSPPSSVEMNGAVNSDQEIQFLKRHLNSLISGLNINIKNNVVDTVPGDGPVIKEEFEKMDVQENSYIASKRTYKLDKPIPLGLLWKDILETNLKKTTRIRPQLEERNRAKDNKVELYVFMKDRFKTEEMESKENTNNTNAKIKS